MKTKLRLILLTIMASLSFSAAALEVGDQAPAFSLEGTDGNTYTLEQFHGKQAIVIAWYPKAFTGGCTIECKSLAQNGHLLKRLDVTYFMASVDELEKNQEFAAETEADFPLLSDPSKTSPRPMMYWPFTACPSATRFILAKTAKSYL